MTGRSGRRARGWGRACALATVLGLGLAVDFAGAEPVQTAFTLRVKSEAGAGALKVGIDECVWDPVLARYTWSLVEPFTVSDPITNDAIATLVMARIQLYVGASPRIQLDFGVEAGGTTTSFILEPSADQALPSHFAMRLATAPPITVKVPPTYRVPELVSTAHALICPSAPGSVPILIQLSSLKVGSMRSG